MGLEEITAHFVKPLQQEEIHLQQIRDWYEYCVLTESGSRLTKH
jgi:hypothetical protein